MVINIKIREERSDLIDNALIYMHIFENRKDFVPYVYLQIVVVNILFGKSFDVDDLRFSNRIDTHIHTLQSKDIFENTNNDETDDPRKEVTDKFRNDDGEHFTHDLS